MVGAVAAIPGSPVALKTFETSSVEAAACHLATIYGKGVSVDYHDKRGAFALKFQSAAFGEMTLAKADVVNLSATRKTDGHVDIATPLDGSLIYRCGNRVNEIAPSRAAAVGRPHETINTRLEKGCVVTLNVPVERLAERASQLTGKPHDAGIAAGMVDMIDLASPIGLALARNMICAMVEIARLELIGVGVLAASGYEELLLNLVVAALFPSLTASFGAARPDCGPAVIRRAREYIRAHAAEAIEMSRLAGDLGISMRAMQENFRRYFGVSPRDYLRECRLDNAHHTLSMPGGRISVTDAAFAAGFTDLGDFSAKYRDKYGELPSQTLRAVRHANP